MARTKLILAIDQGTTNTKVLLIDRSGGIQAQAARPLAIAFPQPGWVEQDALEIWTSVVEAVNDCISLAGNKGLNVDLAAVGVTNQRESVVVWDRRTGVPAGPCVIWQCRRTAAFCEELRQQGLGPSIHELSGLQVDPLFSASKLRWLLANIEDGLTRAAAGDLCAGTVDSWLLWNLTGGSVHATDAGNASRTQLLNLQKVRWDPRLLDIFGIPEACLPEVYASSGIFGYTAGFGSLPPGVPVASLVGDSHAALFGHAAFAPGAVKATYGTGSSLMTPLASPVCSAYGLSTTIAWEAWGKVTYALEGNITNTGGAVQWLGDFLGLSGGADAVAALAATVPDTGGAYLVPAFSGLGAPHWDTDARGVLCGLTRGTTPAHAARATLDSIAYQVFDVFEALCCEVRQQDAKLAAPTLFADGGASRNDRLMQFQSDILGCPVIRSSSTDLSANGAAWLAGLATGYWESPEELERLPRETTCFEPQMADGRRTALISGWREALTKARSTTRKETAA